MLSDLNDVQKDHLIWRLDHNTCCGLLTAISIVKGQFGDLSIQEIFERYGDRTPHSAKILAKKVWNYEHGH